MSHGILFILLIVVGTVLFAISEKCAEMSGMIKIAGGGLAFIGLFGTIVSFI